VIPRRAREAELRAIVQRYATRLEHYVREDPYNWFNWHDFWNLEGFDRGESRGSAHDLAEPVSRGA
jgi:predicted LPLAT superfamily acyltransferase